MRIPALLSLSLLTACAAQPSIETLVAGSSNVALCEAVFYAPPNAAVNAEVQRRGLACQDYVQAIQAQQQMRMQAQQPAQPLIAPLTYRPVTPRTTSCTTVRVGNELKTVCQ